MASGVLALIYRDLGIEPQPLLGSLSSSSPVALKIVRVRVFF